MNRLPHKLMLQQGGQLQVTNHAKNSQQDQQYLRAKSSNLALMLSAK